MVEPTTIEITVTDNGPGFGGVPIEQLFEPYFTTKSSGMGLGLVISRSIVQAHGGTLDGARRIHEGGAMMRVTLPVSNRGFIDVEPTVFIVDDDADALDSLECLLKSIGLKVESYQSPSAFLHTYDPAGPGCIVLDVRMPELSGLELQQELIVRGPTPPIIVITGHGDVPVCAAAFRAGAFDFIEKPVNPQLLLGRIQRAIEHDAAQRRRLRTLDRRADANRPSYAPRTRSCRYDCRRPNAQANRQRARDQRPDRFEAPNPHAGKNGSDDRCRARATNAADRVRR